MGQVMRFAFGPYHVSPLTLAESNDLAAQLLKGYLDSFEPSERFNQLLDFINLANDGE